MKKIRVAIIGYGRSGRNIHTHLLKQLTDLYEVVAYVDQDAQRRQMIKDETGIESFADHIELFNRSDIDLVVNASFSYKHAAISKALLANGFAVVSEKPAAKDEHEFVSVLEAAGTNNHKYFIFQQYRFSPAYLKVKKVIESGLLGRIIQISLNYDNFARRWDWQTVHAFTAGSLYNTGPHPVDHALDLMGYPEAVEVKCMMDRAHTYGDGEDYVKMLLTARNKPVLDIEISSCNAYAGSTYLVQGSRGTLVGSTTRLDWKYYTDQENVSQSLITSPLKNDKGEPIYCHEKLNLHNDYWKTSEDDTNVKGLAYYRSLYKTLTNGTPFQITVQQVKLQMRVMREAYEQNVDLFVKE